MRLLNVGCGGNRPGQPWINVDCLRSILKLGTPERFNLDREDNYTDHDLNLPLLFPTDHFDGILVSHVIEHFDCWTAVRILADLYRVLKPDGLFVVSVPDADYFLKVHPNDTRERAVELFGEPISPDEPWHKTFFDYALFHAEHKQILTVGSLEALLIKAGVDSDNLIPFKEWAAWTKEDPYELKPYTDAKTTIETAMNRRQFSLEVCAVKPSNPLP